MAQLFGVCCSGCGLSATVSGGRDRGFRFWSDTMYCGSCGTLSDVVVEYANDPTHPESFPTAGEPREFGQCHRCGTKQLVLWRFGEPCPRCKGSIKKTGTFILAD